MKIYIMADMEGISGIYNVDQTTSTHALYGEGRRYLTLDVNACIAGCFEGGATEVIVRDAHAGGTSLLWEDVDSRARIIKGRVINRRMPGIDGAAGLILLGYHAMAGCADALIDHTFNPPIQNWWMNGQKVGEIAIDAGIAADLGIPTIMVSGDDKTCAESRLFLPDTPTAQVKHALARGAAILLSKEAALKLVRETARAAVQRCGALKPRPVARPVVMRQEFRTEIQIAEPIGKPYLKRIDGRTFEVTGDSVEEAFCRG